MKHEHIFVLLFQSLFSSFIWIFFGILRHWIRANVFRNILMELEDYTNTRGLTDFKEFCFSCAVCRSMFKTKFRLESVEISRSFTLHGNVFLRILFSFLGGSLNILKCQLPSDLIPKMQILKTKCGNPERIEFHSTCSIGIGVHEI